MVKPIVLANAVTVVSLVLYVTCRALSFITPNLLFALGQSWFHTFNLSSVRAAAIMDMGTFIVGGLTFGILAWITTYAVATLYIRWAR